MQEVKSNLRQELLEKRRNITDKTSKDLAIFDKLIDLPQFQKAKLVLTYVSTGSEVDTKQLIDYCSKQGISVAVPGIVNEEMRFFRLKKLWHMGHELQNKADSICIVPVLAFDQNNFRLGYGGGYYDRFLPGVSAFTVGLARELLMRDELPVQSHDVAVKCVITELEIRNF